MNDICFGANTVEGVVDVQRELGVVFGRARFKLRKWASNTTVVLQSMPEDFRLIKWLTFSNNEGVNTKVLGLHWHPSTIF